MWNRVFLLASGFLFGWTLVSYWSVPAARLRTEALRMGLGLAVGVAVVTLMALDAPQVAIAGGLVWALGALVAYAGNARQVSRVEEPVLASPPDPTGTEAGREGVVLVSELEPLRYDGPAYWAWCCDLREARGGRTPHWFVRPRTYAHIRAAYATALPTSDPSADMSAGAPERLAGRLAAALGAGYRVESARIAATPSLTRILASLAECGIARIVVQPLVLSPEALGVVRASITRARVREVGVRVEVLDVLSIPGWDDGACRLDTWAAGRVPAPPPDADDAVLARLQSRALEPEW